MLQINPRAPSLQNRLSDNSPWTHGCYNPNWMLRPEEPCAMKAQEEMIQKKKKKKKSGGGGVDWEMLSLEGPISSLEEGMPRSPPSVEDLTSILHKCRKEKTLVHALPLHAYMHKSGLDAHTSLGNYLVSILVEVGSMCHAQQVFDRLVYQNECSWNSLIIGYVRCGKPQHALTLYHKMLEDDSLCPSGYAFVALLKGCITLKDLERGHEIHAEIARKGLLERNVFVGSALVDLYAKCGSLTKAQEVFDKLLVRNVVSWNALISGYAEHGRAEEALSCFERMHHEGVSPDAVTLVCSLKACGSIGAAAKGGEIHAESARKGFLEKNIFVGSSLVNMYAKCGSLAKAQEVFDKIPLRNVVLWNTLIAGYAEHGHGEEALDCFEQMQHEGFPADDVTLVCSLKSCGSLGATDKGREIHSEIAMKGLERDLVIGSSLVDTYAKCGLLAEAQEVFDKLPLRDVVSWTALITGYVEHGHCENALNCFEQMQFEGIPPGAVTFFCSLKACGSIVARVKGLEIHAEIARKGFERQLLVGNSVVDFYAKCGLLAEAHDVFNNLPDRDLVSWNALIAGYAKHGCGVKALNCFKQMQHDGVSSDAVTFVCSLKACGSIGATDECREMHADICRKGLERDVFVGSILADMYAKCGSLAEAQDVVDKLPVRTVASWNALIAGYVEHGHDEEALNCFEQMQHESFSQDAITFVCSLKACGSLGATLKGQEIYAEIAKKGLETELLIGNTLIDMYAKCGLLAEAQDVFDKLPYRTVVLWTALIAGYAEHGRGEQALKCFEQMQQEDVSPGSITFVCILKACGCVGATDKGREIYAEIVRKGLLEEDIFLGSTLVDMYAKCGSLAKAQEAFDKLPFRDVVSWTALIAGYAEHGGDGEALKCFEQMQHEGVSPLAVTFVCSLKACGSMRATVKGQEVHAEIARKGLEGEPHIGNTLVYMYAKCGLLAEAQQVFDKLPVRDVVSWTALITGYAKHGGGEEALNCFQQMRHEHIFQGAVTLVCSLKACGSIGTTVKGREIHAEIAKKGLEGELLVGNTLVDMYTKCSSLAEAQCVFDKLPLRDVVSWTALIIGYAQVGESENVFHAFDRMIGEGIKPDSVTFLSVLNACSHAGLVDKGQMYFEAINNSSYNFIPSLEHYTCLVDLLSRAGHLEKAVAMIKKMPFHPGIVVWLTVLGACRKWGNVELGRHAFEHAVRLDEKDSAAYICMSNIYTDAAMQEDAKMVDAMRVEKQAC